MHWRKNPAGSGGAHGRKELPELRIRHVALPTVDEPSDDLQVAGRVMTVGILAVQRRSEFRAGAGVIEQHLGHRAATSDQRPAAAAL